MLGVAEELSFSFYVILLHLDLNGHLWLLVVLLDSTDSRLVNLLCLFSRDPITLCKVSLTEACLEAARVRDYSGGLCVSSWLGPEH